MAKKIKEHIANELKEKNLYGLYMPPELAFFAYNETIGQDNLPLTKEEAVKRGFRWQEDLQMTTGKETLKPEQIPDHIKDVIENILKEILACISCGRNYRITKQEFDFYKRFISGRFPNYVNGVSQIIFFATIWRGQLERWESGNKDITGI